MAIGLLLWTLGACGNASVVTNAEPIDVEADPIWREIGAPLPGPGEDGAVVFSTDDMLTLEYEKATIPALTDRWVGALTAAGWVRVLDTSSEDMKSISFRRGDEVLVLGIVEGLGGKTVTLTRYGPPA